MNNIIYGINNPFPNLPHQSYDGAICTANHGFVDIICQITSPSAAEVKAFRNGSMTFAVYTDEEFNIPFILLKFHDISLTIDASYNASIALTTEWVNQQSNLCTVYLVDRATKILKSIRVLGLDTELVTKFKDTALRQELSLEGFNNALDHIYSITTFEQMYKTSKQQFFNR